MVYTIRRAERSKAKPLIGFYALSGGGKTYSSLVLARGCIGPNGRIVMIETEGSRGEAYADPTEYPEIGGYDVISMTESFSPRNYGDAIEVANKAKPDALIIDSGSPEWNGIGGVLDMANKNEEAGKRGLLVWQRPKMDHQTYFLERILQSPVPLVILNLRAKYPMVEVYNEKKGKKEPVRSEVLEPIQSEDILYELFIHGWIDREHNFHVGNSPSKSLRQVFPDGKPITAETGKALAAWMAGRRALEGKTVTAGATATSLEVYASDGSPAGVFDRWGAWLDALEKLLKDAHAMGLGPDTAAAVWDHNSDQFMRGSQLAKGPAAERFAAVGKLALELRMPPAEESSGDGEPPKDTLL
jgi:hypothetical protein